MYWVLPLLLALAVVAPIVLSPVHRRSRLVVARVALSVFGDYVADQSPRKQEQQRKLRAAHVEQTHRIFASKTLLYTAVLGFVGSIVGVYAVALLVFLLQISSDVLESVLPPALSFLAGLADVSGLRALEWFLLLLVSSATFGATSAFATYYLRWNSLSQKARVRASQIEATLPRTVAFIYALSRSGMSFPEILDTLSRNQRVYGEAAVEIGVAVRDMNTFGTDVLTALRRLSQRTPSENMMEFAENLSSVLGSGRNLSSFLKSQYDRYQEEAEAQQEQYLELLSTFAEAYVTVLVAGPLFLITILVVIGLVLQDTTNLLMMVVYAGIPLGSLAFMVYIASVTEDVSDEIDQQAMNQTEAMADAFSSAVEDADPSDNLTHAFSTATTGDDGGIADGGVEYGAWEANRQRLDKYDEYERVLSWIRNPVDTVLENPIVTLAVTVPLAAVWVLLRLPAEYPSELLELVAAVDEPIAEGVLIVAIGYATVYELYKRRVRAIEAAVPDFLERMASVNDAGMTVVESIHRLTRSDLEALAPEVKRTWRDIEWGADVSSALHRFERRVSSPMVTRAVTLITNAMRASGDIAPVLSIAAEEARATQQLREERRQRMLTYLMVIYVSYFVFLGIIAALTTSFIPAIQNAQFGGGGAAGGAVPGGLSSGLFTGIGDVNTAQYTVMFFHASVQQAVWSGLIAGQLGEGDVRDGMKHAAVMLVMALIAFRVM